ncbi:MAG: extracellular solute-binding protein [Patescibacteria group bacterium]|nr:extracellular solute-binding protein [Patescibacteria group bacterium]
MSKKISVAVSLFLLSSLVFFSGCSIFRTQQTTYQTKLEIWGLFDDSDVFSKAISEYRKRNPRVADIKYKKMEVESYENDLRDALASGKGPDIFLVHDSWMMKHKDKLAPSPDAVLGSKNVQDMFADVVSRDFVQDSKVYALPLSVDSLALYYNRDYFNQAGISSPPRTWVEFDAAAQRLTRIGTYGNITLSGAAMGASSDAGAGEGKINRATDVLTLLMMQAGAEMFDYKNGFASFANFTPSTLESESRMPPGQMALLYYTKFSNPGSNNYSWNSQMHNSVDSFIEGKTAMMLNYSWLIPKIQSKAPKLNLGIAPVPQNIDSEGRGVNVDFANYWGFAVSKNKSEEAENITEKVENPATNEQRVFEAWQFVRYLTMPPGASQNLPKAASSEDAAKYDPAAEYALAQKKPAARRDLIGIQTNDTLLAPFAQGNMIAASWPQPDDLAVEKIFNEMIDDVALRNEDPRAVLKQGQNAVNLLIQKK